MTMSRPVAFLLLAGWSIVGWPMVGPTAGWAADTIVLTLKNHEFTPNSVTVPAGQRFRIEVVNNDTTVEEFESHDLKLEKIVVPGGKITLNAGPLKPGTYKFFGEYHPDQAIGTITAVAP